MRIGIFYYSEQPSSLQSFRVPLPKGGFVHIRVEEVDAAGDGDALLGDALSLASPLPGESVMNTHELPALVKA